MAYPIIDTEECTGCAICIDVCPSGAIDIVGDVAVVVDEDLCTACGECMDECLLGAITDIEEDE
jgi:NAD-dependent dihydropyrimidine dehydrogenase PreA subunit